MTESNNFEKIPGIPMAYWTSQNMIKAFEEDKLGECFVSGGRNKIHNDDKYIRMIWEIERKNYWKLYLKGGTYRKWYGNIEWVVNWSDDARIEYHSHGGLIKKEFWDREGITWSIISSYKIAFRLKNKEAVYSSASPTIFHMYDWDMYDIIGLLNSKVIEEAFSIIAQTLATNVGKVLNVPYPYIEHKKDEITELVRENIWLSQTDWDTFETSWDFKVNPLVASHNMANTPIILGGRDIREEAFTLEEHYQRYKTNTNGRFRQLKENEEELNRIFIEIYGLQDELTPEVANKDVTIAFIFDTKEDILKSFKGNNYVLTREDVIKNLISYAVGCMFGRYSTNPQHYGLVYAGGDSWQEAMQAYSAEEIARGIPDADAIIPICTENYLDDDITTLFTYWLKLTFGEVHFEENLTFIANSLSTKGNTSREVIRNYFLNEFYKDHVRKYQKRPIYWLFDSGKNNGFKALIYMHRYKSDTIARIRTDYVHELQARYRTAIENLERQIAGETGRSSVKLKSKLKALKAQADEAHAYEEKIHHLADQMISIDLDDGVKVNYAKFQEVLAKFK